MSATLTCYNLSPEVIEAMARHEYQNPPLKLAGKRRRYWTITVRKRVLVHGEEVRKQVRVNLGWCDDLTEKQALRRRADVLREVNGQIYVLQSYTKFSDFVRIWQERYCTGLRATTQREYRISVAKHLLPAFGNRQLREVTADKIQEQVAKLRAAGYSPRFIRNVYRGILGSIFARAYEWGYWQERNPVDRVSFGRLVDVREKRLLTPDEHARLMAAMPVAGRLAVILARYTGMRVSEIRGLRWSDVDHQAGVLYVRRRKSYGDVDEPKSAAGRRTIPLGRLAGLLVRPDGAGPDDYVIRLADTTVGEYLREAAKASGVWWRGFGWHTFRREYLTRLQEEGASAIEAARAAGHSRVNQTAEYTLVGRARQEGLALRLQESLDLTWLEVPRSVM